MRLGFIGLGNMGGFMALNLLKAGHALTVHDLHEEAAARHLELGAAWAGSPQAVAAASEIVFTSLPGPAEVERVLLAETGILAGATQGTLYVDLSTSSPTLARRLHAACAERGVDMLDAPVSGGTIGAETGKLAVMVGGDRDVYERARPVLSDFADKPSYIGASGAGCIAKLVHNLIAISAQTIVAEGFSLGIKAGVEPEALLRAVAEGAFGRAGTLRHVSDRVYPRAFDDVHFALALARKDVGLATELAREYDVPLALGGLVEQNLLAALNRGWGKRDASALFLLQEERAGVELRGPSS